MQEKCELWTFLYSYSTIFPLSPFNLPSTGSLRQAFKILENKLSATETFWYHPHTGLSPPNMHTANTAYLFALQMPVVSQTIFLGLRHQLLMSSRIHLKNYIYIGLKLDKKLFISFHWCLISQAFHTSLWYFPTCNYKVLSLCFRNISSGPHWPVLYFVCTVIFLGTLLPMYLVRLRFVGWATVPWRYFSQPLLTLPLPAGRQHATVLVHLAAQPKRYLCSDREISFCCFSKSLWRQGEVCESRGPV